MICAGMMAAQEAVGDTKILTQYDIEYGRFYQITGTTDLLDDSSYTYLQIKGDVEATGADITIAGGSASSDGNFIANSVAGLSILTIGTSDSSDGLLIGSGAAVQVGSLNVDRGTLLVSGSDSATAKIDGYDISVGQQGYDSTIQIGPSASVGSNYSMISVYGNGAIEFLSDAVNASLSAYSMVSYGTLKVAEGGIRHRLGKLLNLKRWQHLERGLGRHPGL